MNDNKPTYEADQSQENEESDSSDDDYSFCKACKVSFDDQTKFLRHTKGLMHTQNKMDYDKARKLKKQNERKNREQTASVPECPASDSMNPGPAEKNSASAQAPQEIKNANADDSDSDDDDKFCRACNLKFDDRAKFLRHTKGLIHTQKKMEYDKAKANKKNGKRENAVSAQGYGASAQGYEASTQQYYGSTQEYYGSAHGYDASAQGYGASAQGYPMQSTSAVAVDSDSSDEEGTFCKACNLKFDDRAKYIGHTKGLIHTQNKIEYDKAKSRKNGHRGTFSGGMEGGSYQQVAEDDPQEYFERQRQRQFLYDVQQAGITEEMLAEANMVKPVWDPVEGNLQPEQLGKARFPPSFNCKLCDVKCTSARTFQSHLEGAKHAANVQAVSTGNKLKEKKKKGPPKQPHVILDRASKIELKLEDVAAPVIGLSYITEFKTVDPAVTTAQCVCTLCESKCDENTIKTHITGFKHRLRFLKERHPEIYEDFKRTSGTEKKSENTTLAESIAEGVEKANGRGTVNLKLMLVNPFETEEQLSRPSKITIERVSKIEKIFEKVKNESVVGLNYITEYINVVPNATTECVCNLCETECEIRAIIAHVTGFQHRLNYLQLYHPRSYVSCIKLSGDHARKVAFIKEEVLWAEKNDGRGRISLKVEFPDTKESVTLEFKSDGKKKTKEDAVKRYEDLLTDRGGNRSSTAMEAGLKMLIGSSTDRLSKSRTATETRQPPPQPPPPPPVDADRDLLRHRMYYGEERRYDYDYDLPDYRRYDHYHYPYDPYDRRMYDERRLRDPYAERRELFDRELPARERRPEMLSEKDNNEIQRIDMLYRRGFISLTEKRAMEQAIKDKPLETELSYSATSELKRRTLPVSSTAQSSSLYSEASAPKKSRFSDVQEQDTQSNPPEGVSELLSSLSNSMIKSEDDAAMALNVSQALTQALLSFRMKKNPEMVESLKQSGIGLPETSKSTTSLRGLPASQGLADLRGRHTSRDLGDLRGLTSSRDLADLRGLHTSRDLADLRGFTASQDLEALRGLPASRDLTDLRGLPASRDLADLRGLSASRDLADLRGLPASQDLADLRGLPVSRDLADLRGLHTTRDLEALRGLPASRDLAALRNDSASPNLAGLLGSRRSQDYDALQSILAAQNLRTDIQSIPTSQSRSAYQDFSTLQAGRDSKSIFEYGNVSTSQGNIPYQDLSAPKTSRNSEDLTNSQSIFSQYSDLLKMSSKSKMHSESSRSHGRSESSRSHGRSESSRSQGRSESSRSQGHSESSRSHSNRAKR